MTKRQCGPAYAPITSEYIDYDEFMKKFDDMLDWVADIYVNALNAIHYMHDKYYYESAQLALKNTVLNRTLQSTSKQTTISHATATMMIVPMKLPYGS